MDDIEIERPGELFNQLAEAGTNFLETVRSEVNKPGRRKRMREFGINDAARLVGRAATTIRESEATDERFSALPLGPTPRDAAGHRVYTLERINKYRELFGTLKRRPEGSKAIRCTVCNFKGGAAKTTTTIHLAQYLALQGYRVLLVDLDPQATASLFFNVIPDVDEVATITDVLIDNPESLPSTVQRSYFPGIDLVPGNLTLLDAEILLAGQETKRGPNPVYRLSMALDTVEDDYDVVLMDCGPNLGSLTYNAIYAATGLLLPMQPMMADFASAVLFCHTMSTVFVRPAFSKKRDFMKILITRHTGTAESANTEAMIRMAFRPHVLEAAMVQTAELGRANNDFGTIYDIETPRGSAETYRRALAAFDKVNEETLKLFETVWRRQAMQAGQAAA